MGLSEHGRNIESYKTVQIESGWAALSSRSPSPSAAVQCNENDENKNSKLNTEHEIIKSIGEGSYGRVVKAMIKSTGKICAIKIIEIGEDSSVSDAENEASIHRQLMHENIVLYDCSWMSDGSFYIRMEYCENGTLKSAIEDGMYSWKRCWMLAEQLMKVMNYLHDQGIAHCDLKSDNILIDCEGRLKLIDFGIAERFDRTTDIEYSEELQTLVYSECPAESVKRDIEDIGKILFEMCYGPFNDEHDLEKSKNSFLQESISSSSDDIVDGLPTQEEVIRSMLNKDLGKLPEPKKSEPEFESEDQFRCPSFGIHMEWFPKLIKLIAEFTTRLAIDFVLIFVVVFLCVMLIVIHSSLQLVANINRAVEDTIEYKAAYWELFKLTTRVTW